MNEFRDLFRWIFLGLVPPELNGGEITPEMRHRYAKAKKKWRYTVAISLWILFFGGGTFILWAMNVIPGQPGFAFADEVEQKLTGQQKLAQSISEQLNTLVLGQLRLQMRETRRLQCIAKEEKNVALAGKYGDDLDLFKEQYYRMTQREWPMPNCGDI